MQRVNTTILITQSDQQALTPKTRHTMKCRDFIFGVLFIIIMLANLVICAISISNGNFNSMGKVINSNNQTCGSGNNTGYPYLFYQYPQNNLTDKQCISSCPQNQTKFNTSSNRTLQGYASFPYLQKICVSTNKTNNQVNTLLKSLNSKIILNNISTSFKQILYLSAAIIGIAILTYFLLIFVPSIIYGYIAIMFVGLLILAFLILKIVEIRRTATQKTLGTQSIVFQDENRMQVLSFVLFGVYFISFPLLMLVKQRLKKAVTLLKLFKYFLYSSKKIHLFNFTSIITIFIMFTFGVFSLINYYSNGKLVASQSPFITYKPQLNNVAVEIIIIIGYFWLISFTTSFHKFIISSYSNIWFVEEQEDSQTFQPLKRSFHRSYYNFGSIAFDSIIFPITFLIMFIYSMSKNNLTDNQQTNKCVIFIKGIVYKIRKIIEISYKYLNKGSFCSMVIQNQTLLLSSKQYASVQFQHQNKYFGFGTILFTYITLFIVVVSLLLSYFVLYFTIVSPTVFPPLSSLIIPLIIILLFSLVVGTIIGNTFGSALDTMIFCTISLIDPPVQARYVYQISKAIEEV